jgi:hypothetical protein
MTGMASGATSLVREFGQGLGPAVISTIAMSAASSALVGKLNGADAGMEAAAGPLAVVNAGSDSARAAAQTALGHGMALGVVICGCASLLGALVTWCARTPPERRSAPPVSRRCGRLPRSAELHEEAGTRVPASSCARGVDSSRSRSSVGCRKFMSTGRNHEVHAAGLRGRHG